MYILSEFTHYIDFPNLFFFLKKGLNSHKKKNICLKLKYACQIESIIVCAKIGSKYQAGLIDSNWKKSQSEAKQNLTLTSGK